VENYVRSAKDALRRSEGSPNIDLARAWILLRHVDGYSGDMEGFQRCLHCAETLIRKCRWSGPSEVVPLDLIEVAGKREIANLYSEDNNRVAMESFCNREIAPVPRMSVLSSDSEVYVFATRIQKVLDRAIFASHGGVVQAPPDEGCDSGWEIMGLGGVDESEARATRTRGRTIGENLYLSRLDGVAKQLW
ncbi:unnamed protein product, partial [Ascophyllum nodosum]